MINIQEDVDEVLLALEQAYGAMFRDGHHSTPDQLACWMCYSMHLVEKAMILYKKNRVIVEMEV